MDDGGLSKFCAFLINLVLAENGFALMPFQFKLAKLNATTKELQEIKKSAIVFCYLIS
jgi:hypothetical protein